MNAGLPGEIPHINGGQSPGALASTHDGGFTGEAHMLLGPDESLPGAVLSHAVSADRLQFTCDTRCKA